ncbi:hypothetical protein [Bacillus cereus]|nr:hypothetical protein [Bacillus cereus]QDD87418.1 hypothetical protein FORC087_635 [Bacillus cereus]
MFKKLIIGTLVTGIVLTGGIGASATTFESNLLADSKVKKEIARYDIKLEVGEKKRVSGS